MIEFNKSYNIIESKIFFEKKPSSAIKYSLTIIFSVIIILLIWANICKMDEIIKAESFLRPIGSISTIRTLSNGKITIKKYSQNQLVAQNDLLFELDVHKERIELNNIVSLIKKNQDELNDLIILKKSIEQDKDLSDHGSNRSSIMVMAWYSEKNKLQLELEQAKKNFEREFSKPSLMKVDQKIYDLKSEVEKYQSNLLSWKSLQLLQVQNDIESIVMNIQNSQGKEAELQRIIANSEVRAPISGYVDEIIHFNEGDMITIGQDVLKIIPQNERLLKAEIHLKASDVARIHIGQIVYLRFPGLPPSEFGQLKGMVVLIPSDITLDKNGVAYFNIEASISNCLLTSVNNETIYLRSGMSASARIVVRNETIMRSVLHKLDFVNE